MRAEIKICFPAYKLVTSVVFIVLLALVRGISMTGEIGITLDGYMPVLAMFFCADTLQAEYTQQRWEVFFLRPERRRHRVLARRLGLQCLYLWLLSGAGYLCFYWQRPEHTSQLSGAGLFLLFFAAVAASIFFWGVFAFVCANQCKNTLAGIGISVICWLFAFSRPGERVLGNFGVFSFAFRDMTNEADIGWLSGKIIAVAAAAILAAYSIRRRG